MYQHEFPNARIWVGRIFSGGTNIVLEENDSNLAVTVGADNL